jgi:hypothetical protein
MEKQHFIPRDKPKSQVIFVLACLAGMFSGALGFAAFASGWRFLVIVLMLCFFACWLVAVLAWMVLVAGMLKGTVPRDRRETLTRSGVVAARPRAAVLLATRLSPYRRAFVLISPTGIALLGGAFFLARAACAANLVSRVARTPCTARRRARYFATIISRRGTPSPRRCSAISPRRSIVT